MSERHHLPLVTLSQPLSRRAVLALAGAAGLTHACGPGHTAQPIDVGAVADFPQGTWTLVTSANLIVSRDALGLYAYTAVCTHENCVVNPPDDTGLAICGCHNSKFGGNGEVAQGPATRPLPHLALTITNGRVIVDPSSVVAATTRTPVPTDDAGTDAGDLDGNSSTDAAVDGSADVDAMPLPGRDFGLVTDYVVGQVVLKMTPSRVFIGRDANGFWAMLGYCTHFAYPLDAPVGNVIVCGNMAAPAGSHGSQYDTNGVRTVGPGGDNTCMTGMQCDLPNYLVTILNGHVYVKDDVRHTVPIGTRVPAP